MYVGNRLLAAPADGVPPAAPPHPLAAGTDGSAGAHALSSGRATAPARAPARNPRRLTVDVCCDTSRTPWVGCKGAAPTGSVLASSEPRRSPSGDSTPPAAGSVKVYLSAFRVQAAPATAPRI